VWIQEGSPQRYHIWARRYTPTGGWGSPERISDGTGDSQSPRIAVDAAGNAIAVWYQFSVESTPYSIWANRYTPDQGWEGPAVIEDSPSRAVSPEIAMNAEGVAMVVWHQFPEGNGYQNIWGRRYTPSEGWGVVSAVELSQQTSSKPRVAVDPMGNAIAVWRQFEGNYNIWAGRFTSVNGWGTSEQLDDASIHSSVAEVAMDREGNAFAVWSRSNCSTTCNVWAARYTTAGGWVAPEAINGNGPSSAGLGVAFESMGLAMVMWSRSDGARNNVWNNRYAPSAGWGSAALVEQSQASSSGPSFGFDAGGNVVAGWTQVDTGAYSIQAANYTPLEGWEVSERIDQVGDPHQGPYVSVIASGDAVAVWSVWDGVAYSVWANRFE
jgi:hypothetical protein